MGNGTKAALAIGGLVLLLVLCGGGYLLLTVEQLAANFRDVLIILLAIESVVVGVFLLLMLWQLYQLIKLLRDEVIPLIGTTKETVEQVQHTTTFVGQSVAAPIIGLTGLVAGVKETVDTLRGKKPPHEIVRRGRGES